MATKKELNQAIDNIELTYAEIIDIANDSVNELTGDLDELIDALATAEQAEKLRQATT